MRLLIPLSPPWHSILAERPVAPLLQLLPFSFLLVDFSLACKASFAPKRKGGEAHNCCNPEEPYRRQTLICLIPCSEINFAICTHPLVHAPSSLQLSLFHQDPPRPAGRHLLPAVVFSQEQAARDASTHHQWK